MDERSVTVRVTFAEHISRKRVSGMVSSMAAYGNVFPEPLDRSFSVEVFRRSKAPRLRQLLLGWERYGFVRRSEA